MLHLQAGWLVKMTSIQQQPGGSAVLLRCATVEVGRVGMGMGGWMVIFPIEEGRDGGSGFALAGKGGWARVHELYLIYLTLPYLAAQLQYSTIRGRRQPSK